jgi:type I restriction enzyme M protein
MVSSLKLVCPIRGELKAPAKSADGLTPSEEARRIEAINFLLSKGYPKDHVKVEATIKRFGSQGRNSFRADLAVLDAPIASLPAGDVDALLDHAVLLGEVKRDNRRASQAKATQVQPLLDFAHREDCIALYWDDTEQRVFWNERQAGKKRVPHEAPASTLPTFGNKIAVKQLTLTDITPTDSLLGAFRRIEDILHGSALDPEQRYGVLLQLLLAKLYDEHSHETKPSAPLGIQDYKALETRPDAALKAINSVLAKAVQYYGKYLPQSVPKRLPLKAETLFAVLEILAPLQITASSQQVMQSFYMYFAKHLYKWDLAQFFTPITVTDFIATALSPSFGEHIKDPACGSADFLTSAYRIGSKVDSNYGQSIWGADNSRNAVQVAVLNMLLNGDGKSNIALEDSLEELRTHENQFDLVICNPPFGTQITDSRADVLRNFDLGYEWTDEPDGPQKTSRLRRKQQVGILFAELCVRQARPGGRIAIILPNGYLGNRSILYQSLREWLLRHCRVASICSFPRFTFKTSGADVSASVLFLERRRKPLKSARSARPYPVHIGTIESVGWRLGDKKAKPIYLRDPNDGSYVLNEHGQYILHTDFDRILSEMRSSPAARTFKWLARGVSRSKERRGWSVNSALISKDPTLCLDPKRWSEKAFVLRSELTNNPHWQLGDLVEFLPQGKANWEEARTYRYVELDDITAGIYRWTTLRGWQLPDRARHRAQKGDIFLGSVWGSVQKWMIAGGDTANLIVTNGCHRVRMRKGKEKYLADLAAALSTEAYATQMRAMARGSDGLAEVHKQDAAAVIIPRLRPSVRQELQAFVDQLLKGYTGVHAKVEELIASRKLDTPVPPKRSSHSVLV